MIKRYHEAPISIFKKVQQLTDGDYALVHLFESDPEYLQMFKDAVAQGRDVILDNSLFELREAFNGERFAKWIRELQPTWYIVPDSWKNWRETIKMYQEFTQAFPDLPGKRIGVAQGETIDDVEASYQYLHSRCDMIAFSLDFSSVFYNLMPEQYHKDVPYCLAMSLGRRIVLQELLHRGLIDENKPHHLLGCGVPQEAMWYGPKYSWIRSIDTCSPVMCGMSGIHYGLNGILEKPSTKMCDCMHNRINLGQEAMIERNIKLMREWCNNNGPSNQ